MRNSKAKIRRTAQNYGVDLSKEIQLPSIEDFKTREEFNEWKHKQKSFTSVANRNFQFRKNEFGVVASKKEIDEIERATKKAQRIAKQLAKQAVNKPFISGGKEQGTVGQRMLQMGKPNTAGIYVPKDFDFDKVRSRKQLLDKKKNMEERSSEKFFDKRMEQMKKNFIEILEKSLNTDADELIRRLQDVPAEDFYEMYLMFDEFDFALWDSDGIIFGNHEEAMSHVSKMLTYVDRYESGKLNMDLKGF